ncbi:ferrous iron transport protein A [Plantibacter sp. Mn2098]|uniref:putative acetyltransferase n=1 Tax=Plantibacter sp. Mn2098 TaxID=3395266 RepID=UPI003BD794FE
MLGADAVAYLRAADIGTRVVVRYHLGDGATDALGDLLSCDASVCVIDTKRGPATVQLAAVIAAKPVPPPPAPRTRRPPLPR